MPVITLSGSQDGLTVEEIQQIISDDWGYNPVSNRFKNMTTRRINRALRLLYTFNPALRIYNVVGATIPLLANTSDYDVRETSGNGGWDWTNCVEVLEIVFNVVDNRPLEKLNREQYRERSELLAHTGPPESWFPIDPYRIRIFPTPDSAYSGVGDYRAELPSITTGKLDWPRHYDEAVLAGVQWLTAQVRSRNQPVVVNQFKTNFYDLAALIEEVDKTTPQRPQQAMVTRHMRSRRTIPTDNSTDVRYWR